MDDLTPTGDTSTALTPAGDAGVQATSPDAAAATLGGDTGVAQVAQQALDQAAGADDPIAQALAAIPADDNDLATYQGQPYHQTLTSQRSQLRVLSNAVRELQPLKIYQNYGDPKAVESRLQIANLLYQPAVGPDGKPLLDPTTRAVRINTRPFVEYIDRTSPGLPEQLLVTLLGHTTENEDGQPEKLESQLFRFYKLNINRLAEYQNIDAIQAKATGAITPEELAEIPSEYHAAYRSMPPSLRNAWKSFDEADQTRMLEDYKAKLETAQREANRTKEDQARKAKADADYLAHVQQLTEQYLDTVRRERTASLVQSLAAQVTYSTDPVANKVKIGSLAATMAQLLDPAWRFVTIENVLEPLGLKLDHTFDAALAKFNANAENYVANREAGATGPADTALDDATSAANQLMAKIAIFALAVAKKEGATVVEKAATQAAQLAAATVASPAIGQQVPTNGNGVIPPGMQPGSHEFARWSARQTGLFTESP